ncbi:MAG TPA: SDR family oxidoreductase [Candidatus Acidoferrales bacterium]|nr:SDR family oxidoreductase [Candidatus Acidoferrales bacterium]
MSVNAPRPDELPSFRLDARLAVITGASEGIGRAFALAYARSGAEIVLISRRREKLVEVQRAVEAAGGRASIICADVSKIEDIGSIEREVSDLIKGRDLALVLVNCAGFGFTKPALDITEQNWDQIMDVHAKGTFFCSQFLGRLMIERGYGKIINLSSTWSVSTDMGKSVYGAAKAGISYLTAALSTEWAPLGVRVNAIAPTSTLTENTSRAFRENEVRAKRLLSRIKLGRFAETSDLVGAAVFLASPASDFITGHTLFVDGGWHAAL